MTAQDTGTRELSAAGESRVRGLSPLAIIPATVEDAMTYAKLVCDARLCPDSYTDRDGRPIVERVLVGILKGLEVGLPPLAALNGIAIINGRPCLWGDGAMSVVQSSGLLESAKVEEIGIVPKPSAARNTWDDSYGFRVTLWRKGQTEPYVGEYTVGLAKMAGLWSDARRVPWQRHPRRMLEVRAKTFALRDGFADALGGLAIAEEVVDSKPAEETGVVSSDALFSDEPIAVDDAASRADATGEPDAAAETLRAQYGVEVTSEGEIALSEAPDATEGHAEPGDYEEIGADLLAVIVERLEAAINLDVLQSNWLKLAPERRRLRELDPALHDQLIAEKDRLKAQLAADKKEGDDGVSEG